MHAVRRLIDAKIRDAKRAMAFAAAVRLLDPYLTHSTAKRNDGRSERSEWQVAGERRRGWSVRSSLAAWNRASSYYVVALGQGRGVDIPYFGA